MIRAVHRRLAIQAVAIAIDEGVATASERCRICGLPLKDNHARQRGVGANCWRGVAGALRRIRFERAAAA